MLTTFTVSFYDSMPVSQALLNDIRRGIENFRAVKDVSMVSYRLGEPVFDGELDDELSAT